MLNALTGYIEGLRQSSKPMEKPDMDRLKSIEDQLRQIQAKIDQLQKASDQEPNRN
jgi:TolA-binding protein